MKSGITYVFYYNHAEPKSISYDYLPLEKTFSFHNFIILVTLVFNEDKNNYHYNTFLEKIVRVNNINMLCYDKIDVFHEIDINKTSASKECDIGPY